MKINEYPTQSILNSTDIFLIDGDSGTRKMNANTLLYELLDLSPEAHNQIFRGKNLGAVYTTEQRGRISDGTFRDLWIGDYWEVGGIRWRIAGINYWLYTGDSRLNTNHIVIVPDTVLYNARMEPSNDIRKGYANSEMHRSNLNNAKNLATSVFGSNGVLTRRSFLVNSIDNSMPSGCSWQSVTLSLMDEVQLYGTQHYAAMSNQTRAIYTENTSQLPLFRVAPSYKGRYITNGRFWLNSPVTNGAYALYNAGNGTTDQAGAGSSEGVRPCFAIG